MINFSESGTCDAGQSLRVAENEPEKTSNKEKTAENFSLKKIEFGKQTRYVDNDGFIYSIDKVYFERKYLICHHRAYFDCECSLTIDSDDNSTIQFTNSRHSHKADHSELVNFKFKEKKCKKFVAKIRSSATQTFILML